MESVSMSFIYLVFTKRQDAVQKGIPNFFLANGLSRYCTLVGGPHV
jgi:hypothetical protein